MNWPSTTAIVCLASGLMLASSPSAQAHHSPPEVIKALTQRIAAGERTVSLLVRRGDEYRAIGNEPSAVADYEAALGLESKHLPALHGLAHARLSQQHFDETMLASQRGIEASRNVDEAAPFHAIRARTYEQQQEWKNARAAWGKSLASSHPDINWFLGEARVLGKLNRDNDARSSLEAAMQRNPSTVLRRVWIESLIRCGDTHEAAKHIEAGLARARWKSSWLLLRASLELSQDQPAKAKRDAESVLQEIEARQTPDSENPYLTANREQALAILNSKRTTNRTNKFANP